MSGLSSNKVDKSRGWKRAGIPVIQMAICNQVPSLERCFIIKIGNSMFQLVNRSTSLDFVSLVCLCTFH